MVRKQKLVTIATPAGYLTTTPTIAKKVVAAQHQRALAQARGQPTAPRPRRRHTKRKNLKWSGL